jgi:MFS family permease
VKLLDAVVPPGYRATVSGPVRRLYLGTFVSCLGAGLTLSLFVIYLHDVRGFSTGFATSLLALSALLSLAVAPAWGTVTDRYGPLTAIVVGYTGLSASLVVLSVARTEPVALVATVLLAVFGAAGWGPGATILGRLVDSEHRQFAFGLNFMLVNLGIGFGGLVSAFIVDLQRPATFTALYLVNAGVGLATIAPYLRLRAYAGPSAEHHDPVRRAEGWRVVARDRLLVRLVIATVVLMVGGYGSQEAGFSLFVVNDLHVSVHAIGVIFFFNTTTIVVAQLAVLARIQGRSRTRVLGVVSLFWCAFWLILELCLALPPGAAIAVLCLAMVVFALGETMLTPVSSAIVNDIAPEHLRGRYNAASGLAWSVSGTLAPLVTGLYFTVHAGNWWPLGTGITALVGGAMMLGLRRLISPAADGRTVEA